MNQRTAFLILSFVLILAAPAASQDTPEGFVLYEGQKEYYTLSIPRDWVVFDQAKIIRDKGGEKAIRSQESRFNLVFFYLPPQLRHSGAHDGRPDKEARKR